MKGDGRHAANAAAVEEEKGERDRHLGLRAKKGMGVRTWLLIDIHGSSQASSPRPTSYFFLLLYVYIHYRELMEEESVHYIGWARNDLCVI